MHTAQLALMGMIIIVSQQVCDTGSRTPSENNQSSSLFICGLRVKGTHCAFKQIGSPIASRSKKAGSPVYHPKELLNMGGNLADNLI